jgi:hypothetical protein
MIRDPLDSLDDPEDQVAVNQIIQHFIRTYGAVRKDLMVAALPAIIAIVLRRNPDPHFRAEMLEFLPGATRHWLRFFENADLIHRGGVPLQ